MKKTFLITITLLLLVLTSCTKTNDCDAGLMGKFIYYETPQEFVGCGHQGTHNALFIPDGGHYAECRIFGSIPAEFQVKDTLHVRISFNSHPAENPYTYIYDCTKYKIRCIENFPIPNL